MIERVLLVAAAALLLTAGCGELTGWLGGDVGLVSFHYSGAETGTFSARGARPEDGFSPHAAGQRLDSPVHTHVYALGGGHQFFLGGAVSQPGTYRIADDHAAGTFYGELALDVANAANSARAIYVLNSGELVLETARRGRIRGRFSGTGHLLNGTTTIEIAGGRFDVPDNLPRPVD